ncbi:MAG: type II toxin-antitoxin system VapC family toxin [Stellaceae bacterium]
MILVDTSVWVDHLRRGDARLRALLENARVLAHPFIVGEIACGSLSDRTVVLELLRGLPMTAVAEAQEVLELIERRRIHGKGLGYVDVHLLAAVALTPGSRLWTRDKRLHQAAVSLHCAYLEGDEE